MDDFRLKETFKRIIREFHETELPPLVRRDLEIPQMKKISKVTVITGPRRSGKTFLTFEIIQKAIRNGRDRTDFLYINFEDERIAGLSAPQLETLLEAYRELYPGKKPVIILDEVQNVPEWEKFVRRLNERQHEIYVTGSNSRLLSKEIATSLRGRCITLELLPFSFAEFIRVRGVTLGPNWQYGNVKNEVKKKFEEFVNLSGYPEIALENRIELVDDYYKTVFYQDVIERYKIKNTELMRLLMRYLFNHYAQNFSINRFHQFAKSNGHTSSTSVVHSYARILEDVYYCFMVNARQKSVKKETSYHKKAYLIDQGFINHYVSEKDKGRILENIVFLELRRRKEPTTYWKNGSECDFVTRSQAIQVCYALDEDNQKREIDGAVQAASRFGLKHALIITQDQEEERTVDGIHIRTLPAWKWLLETEPGPTDKK